MRLKTLTYVSRASLDFSEGDLVDVLATARHLNALEGITGVLVFNGVRFVQIIEGAEDAVDGLVAKLRIDPRHTGFEVRDERYVTARSFPDWSMELVQVDTAMLTPREALNGVLPMSLDPDIRQLVMRNSEAIGETVRLPD